jgi:hypothetical protein
MKNRTIAVRFRWAAALACGLGLSAQPQTVSAAEAAGTTNAAPSRTFPIVPDVPIPQSVFVIPSQPRDGRNPFLPASAIPVITTKVVDPGAEVANLVLNGLTGPPKRTAMINGRTFEAGEEADVRLASGAKLRVKCEQIRQDAAVVSVAGQRRELRLRAGL